MITIDDLNRDDVTNALMSTDALGLAKRKAVKTREHEISKLLESKNSMTDILNMLMRIEEKLDRVLQEREAK